MSVSYTVCEILAFVYNYTVGHKNKKAVLSHGNRAMPL